LITARLVPLDAARRDVARGHQGHEQLALDFVKVGVDDEHVVRPRRNADADAAPGSLLAQTDAVGFQPPHQLQMGRRFHRPLLLAAEPGVVAVMNDLRAVRDAIGATRLPSSDCQANGVALRGAAVGQPKMIDRAGLPGVDDENARITGHVRFEGRSLREVEHVPDCKPLGNHVAELLSVLVSSEPVGTNEPQSTTRREMPQTNLEEGDVQVGPIVKTLEGGSITFERFLGNRLLPYVGRIAHHEVKLPAR
jgi:hypothetical protein